MDNRNFLTKNHNYNYEVYFNIKVYTAVPESWSIAELIVGIASMP